MPAGYTTQDVRSVPSGWKVRTVKLRDHRVNVAFPPGSSANSGVVVAVLHPRNENPGTCTTRQKNPAELILMGANPIRSKSLYDQFSKTDKLILGRAGIGKKDITNESDVREARKIIAEMGRMKNRLPNPGGAAAAAVESPGAQSAIALSEAFHHEGVKYFTRSSEPNIPDGDYTELGKFIDIKVKPANGGPVQVISFEGNDVLLVCDTGRRQLYLAGGDQSLDDASLRVFNDGNEDRLHLGKARHIAYQAVKWHPEVPDGARGKDRPYEHRFGEENGTDPDVWYSRGMQRLLIGRASYHVEGAGIVN